MRPEQIFSDEAVQALFPPERTHDFFDALLGDASEGAYDIALTFDRYDTGDQTLHFFINLHERPGCCLACNLTYGLPEVFSRHPIINIKGLVQEIEKLLGGKIVCEGWKLGHTVQKSRSLHCIPLQIQVREQ
jgi:hypothetical protein